MNPFKVGDAAVVYPDRGTILVRVPPEVKEELSAKGLGKKFVQEGRDRVEAFLAHHSDARLLPSPGHLLPGAPEGAGALGDNGARDDGFYYALLHKRPA